MEGSISKATFFEFTGSQNSYKLQGKTQLSFIFYIQLIMGAIQNLNIAPR